MATILQRLASAQNRNDEHLNLELAQEIAQTSNKEAISELISGLEHKDKNLQSDCIKVLYEIGAIQPTLIAGHIPDFLKLLTSKNNRLVWGALMALNYITAIKPAQIYMHLPQILDAANKGSVIAKDQAANILIKLAAKPEFSDNALILLLELMQSCPTNQLPMYAENALPVIYGNWRPQFANLLTRRLPEMEKESKQKRALKMIKKLA